MWIIVVLVAVIAGIVVLRSNRGSGGSGASLDSAAVRRLIDSTEQIFSGAMKLQDAYPQLNPFAQRLERLHEVLCSYPRADFVAEMTSAIRAVVASGEAIAGMPTEAQNALADYVSSCQRFLSQHGGISADPVGVPSIVASGQRPPNCDGSAFETQFLSLCQHLGSDAESIAESIGDADDDTTNEYGTRFLFYRHGRAIFTVSRDSGEAIYVSSPVTAQGSPMAPEDRNEKVCGVALGDSRDSVRRTWGRASNEAMYVWLYSNRRGGTMRGRHYELAVQFNGASTVVKFEGRLVGESHF